MVRAAVFSCLGLGDGLISLVLSNNLFRNGIEVTTFHPWLKVMQDWFPHLPIESQTQISFEELASFDQIFLFHEKKPRMLEIQRFCEENLRKKLTILNPIATLNTNYPYWENGRFNGALPFADNLVLFCKNLLQLQNVTKSNGITLQEGVQVSRFPKRVVFHPTSSQETKNWPLEKFEQLADLLETEGWEPQFLLTAEEKKQYTTRCRSPSFETFSDMVSFVAESGAMVGNDSGIGHLASCFGLPTVTICRHQQASLFWRPSWSSGQVLTPPKWVPNIKSMRWRDRYWKHLIPVGKVFKAFLKAQP
jgi:heptosyltransferase III